jgi:SAM-dependent methyltransferase
MGLRLFKLFDLFGRCFHFQGVDYPYWLSWYNKTWKNERSVEIALLHNVLFNEGLKVVDVLEVGNVFQHYFEFPHIIIDKYEKGNKVINQDFLKMSKRELPDMFDFVFSISTFEHVGEDTKQPELSLEAIKKAKSLLKVGGQLFFTFPIGWNKTLDKQIKSCGVEDFYLFDNGLGWVECSRKKALSLPYDFVNHTARAVCVCKYKRLG